MRARHEGDCVWVCIQLLTSEVIYYSLRNAESRNKFTAYVTPFELHTWTCVNTFRKQPDIHTCYRHISWICVWFTKASYPNWISYRSSFSTCCICQLDTLLLVPGWTDICLKNGLNSSRHRLNKSLETFLRDFGIDIGMRALCDCCGFVGCASMLPIFCSTTSQIGLRSGYCGGHLSLVNSVSCSETRN